MKKRILALLLAFSMMLSLLPVSALADTGGGIGSAVYASNEPLPDLVMGSNGMPDLSGITPVSEGVYQGNGWKYEIIDSSHSTLTLESGSYDFTNTKPITKGGDALTFVQCEVVVEKEATITGGWFHAMLNYGTVENSLLSTNDIENRGGTMTNCLFKCSNPPVGVANYHKLTEVSNSEFEVTLLNAPSGFTGWKTYYFTGTPKLVVRLSKYGGGFNELQCINVRTDYGDKTGPDSDGYYTFTPNAGEDVVLNLNYYIRDLVITKDGFPDTTGREPIYGTGCRGNGWTYENGTLTLERGKYDFSKDGLGQLAPDVNLVVTGATLTGGAFNEIPRGLTADNVQPIILNGSGLNGSGSIEAVNGLSSPKWSKTLYAIKDSQVEIKASVPLTDINCRAIKSRYYLDNNDKTALRFTANFSFLDTYGGPELILNKSSRTNLIMKEDGSPDLEGIPYDRSGEYLADIYTGDGWRYVDGTSKYLELTAYSYNFRHCDPLNNKISSELAAVTCDITNSSGATIEDGIFKNFVENYGGTIKGGTFAAGLLVRYATEQGTVTGGAFNGNTALSDKAHPVTVHDGHIRKVNDTEPLVLDSSHNLTTGTEWNLYSYEGTIVTVTADTDITNINGWNIGRFPASSYPNGEDDKKTVSFQMPDGPVVLNDTIIHEPFTMTNGYPTASNGGKTACKGEGWEYILGNPEHGDFLFLSNAQIDFSKISDGSPVECKLFIGHGVAVQGGTFNGKVINNGGGILGGTFNDAVENHGTIENGVFNGAVENHGTIENGVFNGAVTNIAPGTVSNSITGTGTLNGKPITPNAYTLTVTGGGLVNGKTSAVVKADEEVRLTVGEGQDGMSFNYWDLPTPLLKALTDEDSNFSNKVESLTFTMPDLSGYTEDTRFTIRLDIRPAELPDDDDGPSVLGTMATVAVGGAAAGILVWQGVSLGVDSYLQLSLPDGVPVPANRRELVKLLWETAGKPDVVLPALYGDVSAEDGELQKATRWAIDNGLVKPADDSDASRFDPDRSVSKYEVARAWFKVQQMLK